MHSAKNLYFFLDPAFRKKIFPQFFQTKREMRAGLEEYLLNFLDALAISIQYKIYSITIECRIKTLF